MKKITLVVAMTTVVFTGTAENVFAQSKKKKEKIESVKDKTINVSDNNASENKAAAGIKTDNNENGYKKLEAGTDYKLIIDAPGDVFPDYGDHLELHLNAVVEDSVIFDTRSAMNGDPAPLQLQKSPFRGDLLEALKLMTAGDSAQVRLSVDSLVAAGAPSAPWMKMGVGQKLVYNLKVVSVTPKALKDKKDQEDAAQQIGIDDNLIQEHLAKNKIKAEKTASGLYYKMIKQGTGTQATPGQKVSVNYTGMLLNGEKFDSNVDPQFQHVQPFEFILGAGNVIRGWDEGIALLKEGGKATLYIPSNLAYGKNSPSPKIPANSVLVFDVELVKIINTDSGQ